MRPSAGPGKRAPVGTGMLSEIMDYKRQQAEKVKIYKEDKEHKKKIKIAEAKAKARMRRIRLIRINEKLAA